MKGGLKKFKKCEISLSELKNQVGENLLAATIESPEIISSLDVIYVIKRFLADKMSKQELADWVNVIWFTDLFKYKEAEENSIASVLTLLETVDEEDVNFSIEEYQEMIECLKNNEECNI